MNINQQYKSILNEILIDGDSVSPRNLLCYEILNHSITINMKRPVITLAKRKLGYSFMLDEACWMISGRNDADFVTRHNSNMLNFSDNGHSFRGAYGPEILFQLNYVVNSIINDRDTRQAVLTIWRPNPGGTNDFACTLTMQFLIRNNKLHLIVNMRSNDVWWGVPYDITSFTHVAGLIALTVKEKYNIEYDLGNLYINAGSRHAYDKDLKEIEKVLQDDEEFFKYEDLDIHEFPNSSEFIEHLNLLSTKNNIKYNWLKEIWDRN